MSNIRLNKIVEARERIGSLIRSTPLFHFGKIWGVDLWLKLELFQYARSFKYRGALNFILEFEKEIRAQGAVAMSGGNHGISVATIAQTKNLNVTIVMPQWASSEKIDKCRELGAQVVLVDAREKLIPTFERIQVEEKRIYVPPFDHASIIAGAGTLGLELLNEKFDEVFIPIGGGGLAAGVSLVLKENQKSVRVTGVQPTEADAMLRSFKSGKPERNLKPETICQSLCAPLIGTLTLEINKKYLDSIELVDDAKVKEAMGLLWSQLNLRVEGAGAIALACVKQSAGSLQGKKVCAIVSGSNHDLKTFESEIAV